MITTRTIRTHLSDRELEVYQDHSGVIIPTNQFTLYGALDGDRLIVKTITLPLMDRERTVRGLNRIVIRIG